MLDRDRCIIIIHIFLLFVLFNCLFEIGLMIFGVIGTGMVLLGRLCIEAYLMDGSGSYLA